MHELENSLSWKYCIGIEKTGFKVDFANLRQKKKKKGKRKVNRGFTSNYTRDLDRKDTRGSRSRSRFGGVSGSARRVDTLGSRGGEGNLVSRSERRVGFEGKPEIVIEETTEEKSGAGGSRFRSLGMRIAGQLSREQV